MSGLLKTRGEEVDKLHTTPYSDKQVLDGSVGLLIRVRDVIKAYRMGDVETKALAGVSFDVMSGGMVALMGPSGSGKSTLLNLIGAIDSPSAGELIVVGERLTSLPTDQKADFRNRKIGFVFQTFNLVPVFTALENVMLPAYFRQNQDPKEAKSRATKLLEMVGLSKHLHQGVNRLSGGQMQRVAIARALMNKPPLILADEPTANLDHATADVILTMLRDVCATEGATVVVATHDFHVLSFCQRVLKLKDGMLIDDQITNN
jgi:putative ABC transport system ATP-binding protein